MLKSLDWKYDPYKSISGYTFIITIIDTDFSITIGANSYWEAIVFEYHRRGLNIAANLARGIAFVQSRSTNDILKLATEFTNHLYDKEIEKYLMLI